MATESTAPPKSAEEKPQNSDVVQSIIEDQQDGKGDIAKSISTPSVFVNMEPMREDQVENAVKFLSHPKVRGSPVIYRRSFLEKKGLTKEEIDEAFRRVPDPSPAVSSMQADGQVKSTPNAQPQAPVQNLQAATSSAMARPAQTSVASRLQWSHVLIGIGMLTISGAGTAVLLKNIVVPRLKSWIRWVVLEEENELSNKINSKPSLAEEAAAAAKAAAAAASDVAKASQEMLNFRIEEKKCFEEFRNLLDVQVREMKLMTDSLRHLEGQSNMPRRNSLSEQENKVSTTNSKSAYINGKVDLDSRSVRSSSPPAAVESSVAPHPKSYMDIMAMVQRGEKPPNIREINDLPPDPSQPLPNPRLAPRPKPWEVGQTQTSSSHALRSQGSGEGLNMKAHNNGLYPEMNGDGSAPWLQQKSVKIREIDSEEEIKTGSYGTPAYERPIQRAWVPPQAPPVAIPEAAAAIRQPKQSVRITEDQSHTSEEADELQRITRISESGSAETNGAITAANSSEIQEEQ